MGSEWKERLWGDLATLEYGKALRGYETSTGRYRVFGTNGPIGFSDALIYEKSSVIVGRKGAYRGIHYSNEPFFVIDTAFYLKPIIDFNTRWAYYELLTHDINGMDSGSAIPSTSRESFYSLPVRFPPIKEQRTIAHILGTLDDKIELNRCMNETLEAIARAIFKSWFVDFDPVRAKVSGEPLESICRRLGLTPELLALFPDRFQDSELGEIPEGWEINHLKELAKYFSRGISPTYLDAGGILVLNQKCIRNGRVDNSLGRRHNHLKRTVEGRILQHGDILVNSTGVGTLGRVAQILQIIEPMIVDSHVTIVRPDCNKTSYHYLGITLFERQNEIEALGEGSTGQTGYHERDLAIY
jgi:type I restriction enzyme S subunit